MNTLNKGTGKLGKVALSDPFWSGYANLVRHTVLPYQWEALNDRIPGAEPSHAVRNFRIAAGLEEGEFHGFVFQDSDLAKWLEAVGHALAAEPMPELEQQADELIDLIALAQQEDGYLNTYYMIKEPGKRWTNLLDCHELYCAGHMIEAAVAYYEATGKRKLLDVVCRFADHIDATFGPEPGKLRGYCGHQEIELALIKLHRVTGEARYLELSRYFIEERGKQPSFFIEEWERRGRTRHWSPGITPKPDLTYQQSHLPVREQQHAVGHSVRAVYMYTAMADLARLTEDNSLAEACRILWSNMTRKQMYITGGIGSTRHGEAFTFDYDLPNETAYAETCASIGLIFFAQRMLQLDAKSEYADAMERALYNNVLAGMGLDGKHYFYVNALDVWPEASAGSPDRKHVKAVRQPWFGCSCCPPNVARLLSSLGQYIYTMKDDTVYTHLFIGSTAELPLSSGGIVKLRQQSDLPWDGSVKLEVAPVGGSRRFRLALRIPSWCGGQAELRINGAPAPYEIQDGYAIVDRQWTDGDTVLWQLGMDTQLVAAHPSVRADAGKAAIQRGPLVYCLEEADNGRPLTSFKLEAEQQLTARFEPGLLGGIVVIEGEALMEDDADWGGELYRPLKPAAKPARIRAVPYALWGNRGAGEMTVWIRV